MSLEQLMALAGHLAQTPRPPGLGTAMLRSSRVSLSEAELQALSEIWRTPLRSQMGERAHMKPCAEWALPGSTARH